MTVKLSLAQAECINLIKRGMKTCPPLKKSVVDTLIRKGLVAETVVRGGVFYYLTDRGKDF